jgi:hypothetical protein
VEDGARVDVLLCHGWGSVSPRTGECLWRGASISGGFSGLLLSGMQGASSEGEVQEIEKVITRAFQVVVRYLYSAELLESEGRSIRQSRSWCGRTATGQRRRGRWRQSTLFAMAFGLEQSAIVCYYCVAIFVDICLLYDVDQTLEPMVD